MLLVALLLLAAAGGAYAYWRQRSAPPEPEPAPTAAAAEEAEASIDPRSIAFASVPAEKRGQLEKAIELHLQALQAFRDQRSDEEKLSKTAGALRLYEEAGALDPELSQLHHLLVVLLFQSGNRGAALREAGRWLERFPRAADHLETLGKLEYTAGNVAAAAEHLKRAAELRPRSLGLQRRLATVYSAGGRKESSLEAADRALRLVGFGTPTLWNHREAEETVRLAMATYHRFYEYKGLLPIAEALLAKKPGDPEALIAAGVARRQIGDYAGAEPYLRRVIDDPQNGDEVRFELGLAVLKQGRVEEAAGIYADLLERSPHFSRAYFQLGQCLVRLGQGSLADAMYAASRALAPSERELLREVELRGSGKPAEAKRARAKALSFRGQLREAEAELRDPELAGHPGLLIYLIEFLVDCYRAPEADEVLARAAKVLGDKQPDVRGWRALVLALKGRAREAAPILEPLASLQAPSNPWPAALGKLFLEDLDDPRAAAVWFEKSLSQPPQPAELARLARAKLLAGDAAGARKLLEGVSRGEPVWEEEIRLPLALAMIQSSAGELKEGESKEGSELLSGVPAAARAGWLYSLAAAEEAQRSSDPALRARAPALRSEADRLRGLDRSRLRVLREAAVLRGTERARLLLEAARLARDTGEPAEGLRLARLAVIADPDRPEPARALAQWLDAPGEVFYRLQAARAWHRTAPQDPEAARLEAETMRAVRLKG